MSQRGQFTSQFEDPNIEVCGLKFRSLDITPQQTFLNSFPARAVTSFISMATPITPTLGSS